MGWWHRRKKFKDSPEDITVVVRLVKKVQIPDSNTALESGLIHFGPKVCSFGAGNSDIKVSDEEKLEILFEIDKNKLIAGTRTIKNEPERIHVLDGLPEMLGVVNSAKSALAYEYRLTLVEALTCDCKTVRELATEGYQKLKIEKS